MATRSKGLVAMLVALGVLALLGWLTFAAREPGASAVAARELMPRPEARAAADLAGTEPVEHADGPPPERSAIVAEEPGTAPARRAFAFAGEVVTPDGAPIAGADVRLVRKAPRRRGESPLAQASTDDDGRFRLEIESAPEETLVVQASREGFEARQHDRAEPDVRCVIELPWAPAVFGTIRDAETNAILAGARVECDGESTVSAADGTYRLATVPLGRPVELRARLDGYIEHEERLERYERAETRLDLALRPGAPLVLTVVDRETGAPVRGAEMRWRHRDEVVAVSDAVGELRLHVRRGDSFSLELRADGRALTTWSVERALPERWKAPRIPMQRSAWIEGFVRDGEGAPLADVQLSATSLCGGFGGIRPSAEELVELGLEGSVQFAPTERGASTDAEGRFEIPVVPCDQAYGLLARATGFVRGRGKAPMTDRGGQRVAVDFVLRRGGTIRGRVLRNGDPWNAGSVQAVAADGEVASLSRIASDGAYTLAGVPEGSIRLLVRDRLGRELLHEETATVEAGAVVELDLAWTVELATIAGTIRDAKGVPLGGMHIGLRDESEPNGMKSERAVSQADGTWSAEVRPDTTYRVAARRGPIVAEVEGVRPGRTDVELVIGPSGGLRIALVEAGSGDRIALGAPKYDAFAWRPTETTWFRHADVRTTVEGDPLIELPAGVVDLKLDLSDSGFVPRILTGIRVTDDEEARVTAEMVRGLALDLELDPDSECAGDPLSDHLVFALRPSEHDGVRGPLPEGAADVNVTFGSAVHMHVDPSLRNRLVLFGEGVQRLNALPPGTYTLRAYPDDLVFEPDRFELSAPREAPLVVRCRKR